MKNHAPVVLSAETLMGNSVRNGSGEKLGKITDFVMDVRSGRVAYAVLDNKLFAVPYQALHPDTVDECFVLNVVKERLEDAPGFDKEDWPESPDYAFVNEVHRCNGLEPWGLRDRFLDSEQPPAQSHDSAGGWVTGRAHE